MKIEKTLFGITEKQEEVFMFTMINDQGNVVKILNYGCIIHSIIVSDKNNVKTDVVTGFDTVQDYEQAGGFVGALVGRCANRINEARFELNNIEHQLYANEGNNHLHGGKEGFSKKIFSDTLLSDGVKLTYKSPDGEECYPGNLDVVVIYKWTNENELLTTYYTRADQDTVVNLTNHSYFNLNGIGKTDIFSQELQINAKYMTPVNANGLLTGEILSVKDTCFDFENLTPIYMNFDENNLQIKYANGYDHNFVLEQNGIAAILYGRESGIEMTLSTNSPGLQFYSGNYVRERQGKDHVKYGKRIGICLEPQSFPNSINFKHFPSPIHFKDRLYTMNINYSFKIK